MFNSFNTLIKHILLTTLIYMALAVQEDDTQFQTDLGEPIDFDYQNHGDDWGYDCNSNLPKQSPIILTEQQSTVADSYMIADYRNAKAVISFLNTTVYIRAASLQTGYGEFYTYTIDNNSVGFRAIQLRFRSHSEHRINNMDGYYDLQLQIFHNEIYPSHNNYKIAIAILFQIGQEANPVLDEVMKSFADNTTSINISLSHFLGKYNEMGYWYYLGSATIPPCNDGKLYWIVLKQIFSMSKEQRDFFYEMFNNENEIIDGNWRNIQDSTNNTVKFYPGYQQQL